MVWTSPTGHKYVTRPGSRLLLPALCLPTGELATPPTTSPPPSGDRGVMMPKRRRARVHNTAKAIAAERRLNDDHVADATSPSLLAADREEMPFAGYALELVCAAVFSGPDGVSAA